MSAPCCNPRAHGMVVWATPTSLSPTWGSHFPLHCGMRSNQKARLLSEMPTASHSKSLRAACLSVDSTALREEQSAVRAVNRLNHQWYTPRATVKEHMTHTSDPATAAAKTCQVLHSAHDSPLHRVACALERFTGVQNVSY